MPAPEPRDQSPEGALLPLAGVTICYVSPADFSGWTRTYRQASTLEVAGARIAFVGWEHLIPRAISDSPFQVVPVRQPTPPRAFGSNVGFWPVRVLLNRTLFWLLNVPLSRPRWLLHERRARRRFSRAIRSTRAGLVQAVDLPALEDAYEASRRMRARLVYDSHEYWAGFFDNPVWLDAQEWAQRLLDLERTLIHKADLVVTVSEAMAQRLAARYSIDPPLVLLNAPPARTDHARPVSKPVRLVFHGGLSSDRNLLGLVEAMRELRGSATLDIHGFTRTADMAQLRSLIVDLGLADTVKIHGPFDYWTVVDLLREYDVGVMAAQVSEENFEVTLPNKVFDCMCAGLAIAMYDSEAMRSLLEAVPYGVILDTTSPESIAAGLAELIADPEQIVRMKQAAVAASERYWWPAQGERLLAAVQTAVGVRS